MTTMHLIELQRSVCTSRNETGVDTGPKKACEFRISPPILNDIIIVFDCHTLACLLYYAAY